MGEGWVALTPIRGVAGDRPLGVFVNDTAISGRPVDPDQQEVLAVFGSLLSGIVEHKRTEAGLRAYAAALDAVTFAADTFLRTGVGPESIAAVLERLGQATGSGRVYVFENHLGRGRGPACQPAP